MTLREKIHYSAGFVGAALGIITAGGYLAYGIISKPLIIIVIILAAAYIFSERDL
jgi:hypothetical protein